MLTPVLGLVVIYILELTVASNIGTFIDSPIYNELPYIYNLPLANLGAMNL